MGRRGGSALAVLAVLTLTLGGTSTVSDASTAAPSESEILSPTASGDWSNWRNDTLGSRYNPAERAITPASVGRLKLKWSYTFPDVDGANGSQPAVVGNNLYVGSRDGKFLSLNAKTGATNWAFDTQPVAGPVDATHPNTLRSGPAVDRGRVFFGDNRGYLYSVRASDGYLLWAHRLSDHVAAVVTGSPVVMGNRVYIGVSSNEEQRAADPTYPCCTFRGAVLAFDVNSGAQLWTHFTVPPAVQVGTSPDGVPEFESAGNSVWSSPVADPVTQTIVIATGNNYSGNGGEGDSVVALDAATGAVRWSHRMTDVDTWTVGCLLPDTQPHCPGLDDHTALDFDFGATPNIFTAGGRRMIGVGQKSGIYHTFDLTTGEIVWQRQVSLPKDGGWSGMQWGTSFDGHKLYVATWQADPGTLYALDPATGAVIWSKPNPSDGCTTGGAVNFPANCMLAHLAAVSTTPGLVYEGSVDGKMRVYDSTDGDVLWQYDTVRDFNSVNGVVGHGGSVSGNGGAVISHGMLYVQSGYFPFYGIPGNVLLAFGL